MKKEYLLRMAAQWARLSDLEEAARRARKQWQARWQPQSGSGFWTSFGYSRDDQTGHLSSLQFNLPLGDYLALFPNELPIERRTTYHGIIQARMDYPPKTLGQLKNGCWVWVQSGTPAVPVGKDPAALETEIAQTLQRAHEFESQGDNVTALSLREEAGKVRAAFAACTAPILSMP